MGLTTASGIVSNLQFSSETSGHMNKGSGNIHTKQVVSFRLDGKSVIVKLPNRPDIAEGEPVTVAGKEKNGLMTGLALRNDKTNVIFAPNAMAAYIFGGIMLALGIMTLIIILGIFIIPMAAYVLYQGYQYSQAQALLAGKA